MNDATKIVYLPVENIRIVPVRSFNAQMVCSHGCLYIYTRKRAWTQKGEFNTLAAAD